ncbi:MAG: patatin-like phospholipase family protein [Planctomycetota bacterium]
MTSRLSAKGPHRILALDGGGIRGTISLGYLARIEQILRDRLGRENLVLADYFDLIGGTSTGAIIAACLAMGKSVDEIRRMYLELGGEVFARKRWDLWNARFDEKPLVRQLTKVFGDLRLGDPALRTGLCIIAKRADTGSTWPLLNHPDGQFYDANKSILLRQALRASSAAPTFFTPVQIDLGDGQSGAFIDGGVSMANNPSMQLLLVATLKGFAFRWPVGADNLLLVSIGTGHRKQKYDAVKMARSNVLTWASQVPRQLIEDASWQNQLLLQYLSRSLTPWPIDLEVGDLGEDLLGAEPLLTYLRYDVSLEGDVLASLGLDDLAGRAEQLFDMAAAENRLDLDRIGQAAAGQIVPEHFPRAFDSLSQESRA